MSKIDYKDIIQAEETGEGKGAVFNMAFSLLDHLNRLIVMTSIASMGNEYVTWFKSLAAIYRIISSYVPESAVEEFEEKFTKLWLASDNYESIQQTSTVSGNIENRFIKQLHEFDKELKAIMKRSNLLIPVREGIGSALDG